MGSMHPLSITADICSLVPASWKLSSQHLFQHAWFAKLHTHNFEHSSLQPDRIKAHVTTEVHHGEQEKTSSFCFCAIE